MRAYQDRILVSAVLALTILPHMTDSRAQSQGTAGLFEMTIEELGNLPVVSQARRVEPLDRSPAAAYIITGEEIRRSGVTTIAEALRLAPGVEVARNGTSSWTISMRGFNSDLSNKLLVLVDGRSVYSPLFAGVFWDAQDTLLADIDRIEVIAGPGGTIWGANAVNGVINIITRSPGETHGLYSEAGAGQGEEAFAALRYGAGIGEHIDARAYVKHFDRNLAVTPDGRDVLDDWQSAQAGFNLRWDGGRGDRVTLRGDVFDGEQHVLTRGDFTLGTFPGPDEPGTIDVEGYNVVARWRRDYDGGGFSRLQFFADHTDRRIPGSFDEARDTYDLDWQRDLAMVGRHALTFGAGLRMTTDELNNTTFASFLPVERTDRTASAFVQDRVEFRGGDMALILGSKFEHNDFTGFEHQPGIRYFWAIDERQSFWASASRAVRTPARLNTDIELLAPISSDPFLLYVNVFGNPDFESEELLAREAGYRVRFGTSLSLDFAAFDNEYDKLQTQEPAGPPIAVAGPPEYLLIPARMANGMRADTYGGTIAAAWQPLERWRLRLHYSQLEMDLSLKPGFVDTGALSIAGNSPERQIAVHAFADIGRGLRFYAGARYVSALPNQNLDSRVALDTSLSWRATDRLEAALTVRNLNDSRHIEFGDGALERSIYLRLAWTLRPSAS